MLSVIKLHPATVYSDDIPINNHDVFLVNSRVLLGEKPTDIPNHQQVQVSGNQSVDQNHLGSKSLENAWGVATYDQKG